jgi:hypothetical protein
VKANGGAHFSVPSGGKNKSTTNGATPRTPSATPRKPRAQKAGSELTVTTENGEGAATKSGKRKRASGIASPHASQSASGSQSANGNGVRDRANVAVKMENPEEEAEHEENGGFNGISPVEGLYDDEEESPSKRMRKLSVAVEGEGEAEGEAEADADADQADDDGDYKFLEHLV